MKKKVIVSIVSLIIVLLLLACGSVVYVNASTSESFDKLQLISQEVTGTDVDLGFLHTQEKIDAEMKTLSEQKDSLDKSLTATSDSLNIKLDDILKVNDKSKEDLMSGLTLEEQVQYLNALASVDDMVYIKKMDNYEADKSNDKIKTALESIQSSVDSSYDAVIKELSGDTNSKKETELEVSEETSGKKVVLTKKDINEFLKLVNFDKKFADEVINVITTIEVSEDLVKTLDDVRTTIVKQVKLIDTEVKSIKKKEKEEAEAKKKAEEEAKAKAEAEALASEQAEATNSYNNDSYYSSNDYGYSSSASNASSSSSTSSNSGSSSSNSGGSSSNSGGGATIEVPETTYPADSIGALGVSGCASMINSDYVANGWIIDNGPANGNPSIWGSGMPASTSCHVRNIASSNGGTGHAYVVDNGNGTYDIGWQRT